LELATPVCGTRSKVFKWLDQVNSYLDDQRPIDMIETIEGANKVLQYVERWIQSDKKV
jgi:6-hydroxy-3-succinoylpyridine 3-monooxygenase